GVIPRVEVTSGVHSSPETDNGGPRDDTSLSGSAQPSAPVAPSDATTTEPDDTSDAPSNGETADNTSDAGATSSQLPELDTTNSDTDTHTETDSSEQPEAGTGPAV